MTDPLALLKTLHRPRLLISAAHLGILEYNRDRSLRRLLPSGARPSPVVAFPLLVESEAAMDAERRTGGAGYSVSRHVETLAALIVEARLLARSLA